MKNLLNTKLKDMKAITLIALVITIVVLIILVGVIINITLGNGGIINRAKTAKEMYVNAQAAEQEQLKDPFGQLLVAADGTITANAAELKEMMLDIAYPKGSIMITTDNRNPGTYLGGEWVAYAEGRTIVGVDSEDTDFDTVEETGGEKTHTLTVDEMPSHNHAFTYAKFGSGHVWSAPGGNYWYDNTNTNASTGNTGGSQPHNNLQPYIVTYIWKRTK